MFLNYIICYICSGKPWFPFIICGIGKITNAVFETPFVFYDIQIDDTNTIVKTCFFYFPQMEFFWKLEVHSTLRFCLVTTIRCLLYFNKIVYSAQLSCYLNTETLTQVTKLGENYWKKKHVWCAIDKEFDQHIQKIHPERKH